MSKNLNKLFFGCGNLMVFIVNSSDLMLLVIPIIVVYVTEKSDFIYTTYNVKF